MDTALIFLVSVAEWTFLTSAKATVVIGLVLLSQMIFNRWLSARGRYALWFAVILCLAVPYNIESRWSVFGLQSLSSVLNSSVTLASGAARDAHGEDSLALLASTRPDIAEPPNDPWRTGKFSSSSTLTSSRSIPWYIALWVSVGIGLLCLTFYNQVRYLRVRAAASHVTETTQALVARCREEMGLHRHVHVLETSAVTSPSVFGCIAPAILLPEGLQHELSERDLRHVFLHELAHVKRHDLFLNWLTMFLQILHWFNPAIWFSFSRMRSDREQACDAYVLERLPKAEWRDYGNTLIKLTDSFPVSVSLVHGVGIVESQKRMKARLQMIKRFKLFTMRHALVPALLLPMLVVVALAKTSAQEDTQGTSTVQTVVGVGPAWKTLNREVGSSYKGSVSHHSSEDSYPKVLSWSNPGDTFVLMFAFDLGEQRPPEEYHDMLPRPWTEIESSLKQGENLEMTGEARGLRVVLLAAPTLRKLQGLIQATPLLDKVRHGPPKDYASHDFHGIWKDYEGH